MVKLSNYLWQYVAISVLVLFATSALNAQEPGALIFSDSFDKKDTFAENWIKKGKLIEPTDGNVIIKNGELILRRETPLEFYVEFDLTLFKDKPENNKSWAGLMLDGNIFMIQPTGKTFLLWKEIGQKRSSGLYKPFDGYENGRPVKLGVSRVVESDKATYTFYINGNAIKSFVQNVPEKKNGKYSPLQFSATRLDSIQIDNFKLSEVKKDAAEVPAGK